MSTGLCSKGSALGETLSLDGRLLHPEIGGRRVSWDAALREVATGLRRVIDRHGPGGRLRIMRPWSLIRWADRFLYSDISSR